MRRILATIPLAVATCTPSETTQFRTTDQSDPSEPDKGASYRLRIGERGAARVQVWSNGGYLGTSDEPMTHVGFDIHNTGAVPLEFDVNALRLAIEGEHDADLPPPKFVAITPLGPSRIAIAPGSSSMFDSYYELSTKPTEVEKMEVRWKLAAGNTSIDQLTTFVRDDDAQVVE
jgi:hypothetical protein